jgi:hypothetical protein
MVDQGKLACLELAVETFKNCADVNEDLVLQVADAYLEYIRREEPDNKGNVRSFDVVQ